MNGKEVAEVFGLCQAKFPAMAGRWHEFTPDAWEKELLPLPKWLAIAAVYQVAKSRTFLSESDIHVAARNIGKAARANVRRLRPLDLDSLPRDVAEHQAARRAYEHDVEIAAEKLIERGAIDFSDFDATAEFDVAPELKVAADHLARILPPTAKPQLPPANPVRRRLMLDAATPRPEASRPPKVDRDPIGELSDAQLSDRAADRDRQQAALRKLIEGAA